MLKQYQEEILNSTIGKLIVREKYKLINKTIIAEVCKDVINSLIYEEVIK